MIDLIKIMVAAITIALSTIPIQAEPTGATEPPAITTTTTTAVETTIPVSCLSVAFDDVGISYSDEIAYDLGIQVGQVGHYLNYSFDQYGTFYNDNDQLQSIDLNTSTSPVRICR
jgi:hypothetical protein